LIEQEVTWLCGEFEGEAAGRFFTQKVSHKQGIVPFQLCMKSGLLRNVEQTEEPIFDGVEHVFKQELIGRSRTRFAHFCWVKFYGKTVTN